MFITLRIQKFKNQHLSQISQFIFNVQENSSTMNFEAGAPVVNPDDIVKISHLQENMKDIPILANVLYNEWSTVYHSLGCNSVEDVIVALQSAAKNKDKLPLTFVAHDMQDSSNPKLVCTASIDVRDLPNGHPYGFQSFWLNCVYTMPEYRGKGHCYYLLKEVIRVAISMKLHCLWLYTENMERAYKQLGFRTIEYQTFQGKPITIMRWDNVQLHSKL